MFNKIVTLLLAGALCACSAIQSNKDSGEVTSLKEKEGQKPLNVVFILSDDHRYDMMGFMDTVPYLETPSMDRMANEGAHVENAYVTTSLCSPSRASILTGQYTHRHGVVDNQSPVPDSAVFFPQFLQKAGYQTGFVGKWHMGRASAEPRRGFDHWVSFRGQGQYYGITLNENGKQVNYDKDTYTSELLTDKALDFLNNRNEEKPFFLYLSHKAVHHNFMPAQEDKGKYRGKPIDYPLTMFPPDFKLSDADGESYNPAPEDLPKNNPDFKYNYKDLPEWVKEQRESFHGVDYMYRDNLGYDEFYYRYLETLLGIDRSIGRVIDHLEKNDMAQNTVVIYMGDNGFSFGEHGLIDKRQAYEESIRVPMLVYAPSFVDDNTKITSNIMNTDIAPTILELSGLQKPDHMDGTSFVPALKGQKMETGDKVFYEYFWERLFPQTPTVHAVRTDSFKFIRYQGIWNNNELYNLAEDPKEANNLIHHPKYQDKADELNQAILTGLKGQMVSKSC